MKRFVLAVILISACSIAVICQTNSVVPSISVVGEAEMSFSPDNAVFTLEVVSLDKNLSVAKKANDLSVVKTLAAAKIHKVAEDDVQTETLTISPKYRTLKRGQTDTEFVGYEVTKRISVTLRDLKELDSFLSDVIAAGVNKVVSVDFADSQYRQHQEQVRALAVKNARDKATAYAQQLGQKIGKAYSIREDGADYPSFATFSGSGSGSGDGDPGLAPPRRGSGLVAPVTFAVGQISIEETIYIIFALE